MNSRISEVGEACSRLADLEGTDGRVGAFLDLDHTVLHGSSGVLFVQHMWRLGRVSRRQLLRMAREGVLYKLGRADFTASSRELIRMVAGVPDEEMWAQAREWFKTAMAHRVTAEAAVCAAAHKARRHQVAILSASTPYAAGLTAEAIGLGIDDAIATRLESRDGVLTGEVIEPMCFGEGKIYWAERFAEERGIDLARSYFYTDSYNDLPMLRRVGHPVMVNPDVRLRRLGRAEGWPSMRFY